MHVDLGGSVQFCPGSQAPWVIGVGGGDGASARTFRQPANEATPLRIHGELSRGIGPSHAGTEANVPLLHPSQSDISADGQPFDIGGIGPDAGATLDSHGVHLHVSGEADLTGKHAKGSGNGRKPASGSGSKAGAEGSVDLEIPLPRWPSCGPHTGWPCFFTVGHRPVPLIFVL